MVHKVLVVEDDIHLNEQLGELLSTAGHLPLLHHTAEAGLDAALDNKPDLILLDVMVPQMGGWELCRQLRRHTDAPILFMTALTGSENVVRGLTIGADDFISKPFDRHELLARIAAHLRRRTGAVTDRLTFGDNEVVVDFDDHAVTVRGEKIDFTPREFNLLGVLVRNAGQVVRTQDLMTEAWGENYGDMKSNIKPYIHYLRKKIEVDPAVPKWIKTVRGVGYRFTES